MLVICVTAILVGSARLPIQFAYAFRMADDSWKDARVRQAEAALAAAVRTADEIIADAQRAAAPPEPPEQRVVPDVPERPILRDAW